MGEKFWQNEIELQTSTKKKAISEHKVMMSDYDSSIITNFSGEVGDLGFSDYKDAFTTNSTINTGSVDLHNRSTSMKGVEQERANISYQLSPEDQQRVAYQEALQQREERARVQRLQVYDQKGEDMYTKVHQLLLR